MNATVTTPRKILWPNVLTVVSATILIGAEVFGAAFAGGWAAATLFGLEQVATHIFQGVFALLGLFVVIAFIRAAKRVEPFTS